VHVGTPRGLDERLDDVWRRALLGIPAPEVDERRPCLGRGGGDTAEERDEVLLREPVETDGTRAHPVIVFGRSPAEDDRPQMCPLTRAARRRTVRVMSEVADRLDRYEARLRQLESELAELRRLVAEEQAVSPAPEPPLWELLAPEPEPGPAPVAPEPEPRPRPVRPRRELDLSVLLGPRALAWTGGAVMLLGIVFFFVLAAERGWIGPIARVALGALASSLCVGAGLWLRRRFGDTYASVSAAGAGIAGFYATLLAAVALYDLVPRPPALALAAATAGVGAALALRWRSQTLATLGLLGANLVPLPIALQDRHLSATGTAFAALVFAATTGVALPRRWHRLHVASFTVTTLLSLGLAVHHHDWAVALLVWVVAAAGPLWLALRDRLSYLPATLLLLGAAFGGWSAALLFHGTTRGVVLLGLAAAYGAVSVALRRRDRDCASLLWAIGLTLAALAAATLLSGATLTIVWAAEAAVLAWLARRVGESRFQVAALGWLTLAYLHGLEVDAPLRKLFVENGDTRVAALSAASLAVATAAVGFFTFERDASDEPSWLADPLEALRRSQTQLRSLAAWHGGGTALYAGSLLVVTLPASWSSGHLLVAILWSALAVALVLGRLGVASLVVTAASTALVVGYDLRAVDDPQRWWAFAAVAAAAVVVAVVNDLRSRELEPLSFVALGVGAVLSVVAVAGLLDGRARGGGLLALAAAYGATGVAVLARRRDFASGLGVVALAVSAPAPVILLDGTWLVLAWATACASLAVLNRHEERLVYGALTYLGLALGQMIAFEAQPSDLFVAHRHPGHGLPAVALVLGASLVLARRTERLRNAFVWLCGGVALYGVTLLVLELGEDASGAGVVTSFQRGHTAVSAVWGAVGLTLLVAGLKHAERRLRIAGLTLFALSLVKLFVYDLAFLSSVARALSFLAVGGLILVGGFFYQRLAADLRGPDLHSHA
jgi:uncharacterized membrane protein